MAKIVFFTKYTAVGASSRYRVFQYLELFKGVGFDIVVHPFFTDEYLLNKYSKKRVGKTYLLKRYLQRIRDVFSVSKKDFVYIEYELFPYMPAWFERRLKKSKRGYVVDYDDAIFHNYDQHTSALVRNLFAQKIPAVIKNANKVIAGSSYLRDFALKFNQQVVDIPTSVNFSNYAAIPGPSQSQIFTIGWIGLASNSINVLNILSAIRQFAKGKQVQLVLIGFDPSYNDQLTGMHADIRAWREDREIEDIKSFDVGIMPLIDTSFNRGKCGFKLIQYMACGVPTISTPLPANVDINRRNENLFATNINEWVKALDLIYNNREFYSGVVGLHNKEIVQEYYSLEANHTKFIELFKN